MNGIIQFVGVGEFGKIFIGLKNYEAIQFILKEKSGEILSAMYREEIGYIDFIYGKSGSEGYGLAHIQELHPEILPNIVEIINNGVLLRQKSDRVIILHKVTEGRGVAVIRLDWNGERKQWLVSAF